MALVENLKNLSRHSLIYTFSTFVQRALGLIMLPVYTDTAYIASKSNYGDYALVYVFIAFMNIIYMYGMDAAFLRYFFLGKYSRDDVFKTTFLAVLANILFFSILIILFADNVAGVVFAGQGYGIFIKITAGILFFDTMCNLTYVLLRSEEKSVHYTFLRMGRFGIELLLNVVFVVVLRLDVIGILYANLVASIFNYLVLFPFQIKYLKGTFRWEALKELLKFGLPMIPNGLAYLIVEVSDKFLMSRLLDKETLGTYSANYRFGSALLLVVIAFRTAWQPFFLKVAKLDEAKRIYAKVMTYFLMIGAAVVILVSYYFKYMARIPVAPDKTLLGSAYWEGIVIIPIILSSYLLYGMYVNMTVGIYIEKKSQLMFIFSGLAAIVNVGSNLYLMPQFGMMGAAFATLLSYITMALSIFIANQRIYPVHYEWDRILIVLVYLAAMLAILYAFDLNFIERTVLIIGSPFLLLPFGIIRKEELTYLKKIIQTYRSGRQP